MKSKDNHRPCFQKASRLLWQKLLTSGLSLFILMASCQENTYHYSYQPVCPTGWKNTDTLTYRLNTPLPENQAYGFQIGIRHQDTYHYRDLWLTVNQDTVHLYLADSTGNWLGNGIGELRQAVFPISYSPQCDSIREIRITHIMQDNPLSGIHDIGIRISGKH